MTALADGGFVVTWSSLGQDGSDYTSERTFLSYLLKPLQDQFALAFRER